jgi:hypothetical protein
VWQPKIDFKFKCVLAFEIDLISQLVLFYLFGVSRFKESRTCLYAGCSVYKTLAGISNVTSVLSLNSRGWTQFRANGKTQFK